jgi:hypothetical protein
MIIERVSLFFQARTDFKAKFERFWKRCFEEIWTRRHGTRGNWLSSMHIYVSLVLDFTSVATTWYEYPHVLRIKLIYGVHIHIPQFLFIPCSKRINHGLKTSILILLYIHRMVGMVRVGVIIECSNMSLSSKSGVHSPFNRFCSYFVFSGISVYW